jgi:hypothetical protein
LTSEIVGIIDDRHKEICRRDYTKIVRDLPNRRIVRGLVAHQKLWKQGRGLPGEKLLKYGWRKLAAASAAVRQFRKPNGW